MSAVMPRRAVYARALARSLAPTAEDLALTLCKPTGGVAKNTTATPPPIPVPTPGRPHRSPRPHPADPRHWTPPLSFSGVDRRSGVAIGPEPRHLMRTDGSCASRDGARREMLQAAETLKRPPPHPLQKKKSKKSRGSERGVLKKKKKRTMFIIIVLFFTVTAMASAVADDDD